MTAARIVPGSAPITAQAGRAVGLQIAIYNPDFDPDGSNGRGLAATIRDALIAGVSAGGGCVA